MVASVSCWGPATRERRRTSHPVARRTLRAAERRPLHFFFASGPIREHSHEVRDSTPCEHSRCERELQCVRQAARRRRRGVAEPQLSVEHFADVTGVADRCRACREIARKIERVCPVAAVRHATGALRCTALNRLPHALVARGSGGPGLSRRSANAVVQKRLLLAFDACANDVETGSGRSTGYADGGDGGRAAVRRGPCCAVVEHDAQLAAIRRSIEVRVELGASEDLAGITHPVEVAICLRTVRDQIAVVNTIRDTISIAICVSDPATANTRIEFSGIVRCGVHA